MKAGRSLKRNIFFMVIICIIAYLVTALLEKRSAANENILLIYVIGLLATIIITKSYSAGIIVSIVEMIFFNFYFINPKGSILMENSISFILFLITAVIVGKIVTSLQQRTDKEIMEGEISKNLYEMSQGLINIRGLENIIHYSEVKISHTIGKDVMILWGEEECENYEAAKFCYENILECGVGFDDYSNELCQYFPIYDEGGIKGVVRIPGFIDEFGPVNKGYIKAFFSMVIMAVERDKMARAEEESRMNAEREKFKSDLLHSISHDLRTPLTVISGGAEFLSENLDSMDNESIKGMLVDIVNDAEWLSSMVENLLNMTRIQEGKLVMNIKVELAEDIVSSAAERVKKHIKNHTLTIEDSEEMLFVKVDSQLITKVIINLMDNAFRHTREDSDVICRTYSEDDNVIIEVSDNGGGIPVENLNKIFESFFTTGCKYDAVNKCAGIGLSICRSIVEAHGGSLEAENNSLGGATFRVILKEEVHR